MKIKKIIPLFLAVILISSLAVILYGAIVYTKNIYDYNKIMNRFDAYYDNSIRINVESTETLMSINEELLAYSKYLGFRAEEVAPRYEILSICSASVDSVAPVCEFARDESIYNEVYRTNKGTSDLDQLADLESLYCNISDADMQFDVGASYMQLNIVAAVEYGIITLARGGAEQPTNKDYAPTLISESLSKEQSINIGDYVYAVLPLPKEKDDLNEIGYKPLMIKCKVTGIFSNEDIYIPTSASFDISIYSTYETQKNIVVDYFVPESMKYTQLPDDNCFVLSFRQGYDSNFVSEVLAKHNAQKLDLSNNYVRYDNYALYMIICVVLALAFSALMFLVFCFARKISLENESNMVLTFFLMLLIGIVPLIITDILALDIVSASLVKLFDTEIFPLLNQGETIKEIFSPKQMLIFIGIIIAIEIAVNFIIYVKKILRHQCIEEKEYDKNH